MEMRRLKNTRNANFWAKEGLPIVMSLRTHKLKKKQLLK